MKIKVKKRNDQYTQYLLITGVVAIVAIVALVFGSNENLEGALSYSEDSEYQKFCTDTDSGNYFDVVGTVKLRKEVFVDHCDGEYLHQQFCRSRKHVSHTTSFKCSDDDRWTKCFEGACV